MALTRVEVMQLGPADAQHAVIWNLVARAFSVEDLDRLPKPHEAFRFLADDLVYRDDAAAFVAYTQERMAGIVFLDGSTSLFQPFGWVAYIYADAPGVVEELLQASRRWFLGRGITQVRAFNGTRYSDEDYAKHFEIKGSRARAPGGLIEFDITEA